MTQTANIDRASVSHRWTIATAESALTNGAAKINAGGTAARSPAARRIPFRTAFDETLPIETPKEQNGYAQGFVIQTPSIWHNGSMDGTSSALKFENGYGWAVVTNTRENGPNPFGVGDPIIRGSIVWPSVDLFDAPQ